MEREPKHWRVLKLPAFCPPSVLSSWVSASTTCLEGARLPNLMMPHPGPPEQREAGSCSSSQRAEVTYWCMHAWSQCGGGQVCSWQQAWAHTGWRCGSPNTCVCRQPSQQQSWSTARIQKSNKYVEIISAYSTEPTRVPEPRCTSATPKTNTCFQSS